MSKFKWGTSELPYNPHRSYVNRLNIIKMKSVILNVSVRNMDHSEFLNSR